MPGLSLVKELVQRLGELFGGLDHLSLLFECLFEGIGQVFELLLGVVGQVAFRAMLHFGQFLGLRAAGHVEQFPQNLNDAVVKPRR